MVSHLLLRLKEKLDPFKEIPSQDELILEFKEVYNQNKDYIRNVVFGMVRNESVDDLVQETFYKAWRSFHKFRNGSSHRTWLYRIAMNSVYDYLRSNKNYVELCDIELPDTNQSVSENAMLSNIIDCGIRLMGPKHREVFMLYYHMGHSISEIAKLLKVSEGTVKSRLYYARDSFTHYLKANGVEDER